MTTIELSVPQVGESINEVQIGHWVKQEGDFVRKGEILVEIETDKVTVELPAPASGRMGKVLKSDGASAGVGEVIGYLEAEAEEAVSGVDPASDIERKPPAAAQKPPKTEGGSDSREPAGATATTGGPAREVGAAVARSPEPGRMAPAAPRSGDARPAAAVSGKQVVQPAPQRAAPSARPVPPSAANEPAQPAAIEAFAEEDEERDAQPRPRADSATADREEQIVPMSPLRRRIAQRLVQAQQAAALLTTFNEVDMSAVMSTRARHQEAFSGRHAVKLGIMSFFVKAAVDALKRFPQLNAEIRGADIVFRNHYDIGVAVSTDKGLVVPILVNAERMSFAEIEQAVADFSARARENKLKLGELEGGTFTLTNGGVFGSLLSTPIVNPPQSGILGLHAIQDRPVARDGQVVIRPMMYIALTYDHRIVDGREAVSFLRRIKEVIEEPSRMLIEI